MADQFKTGLTEYYAHSDKEGFPKTEGVSGCPYVFYLASEAANKIKELEQKISNKTVTSGIHLKEALEKNIKREEAESKLEYAVEILTEFVAYCDCCCENDLWGDKKCPVCEANQFISDIKEEGE